MHAVKFWPRPLSARSSARAQGQQVMNLVILENNYYTSRKYDWRPSLAEIAILFGETHLEVEVKSPTYTVRTECHDVKHNHSHDAVGHLKNREQIIAMHSVDKS